jgi:hypothetical protein
MSGQWQNKAPMDPGYYWFLPTGGQPWHRMVVNAQHTTLGRYGSHMSYSFANSDTEYRVGEIEARGSFWSERIPAPAMPE